MAVKRRGIAGRGPRLVAIVVWLAVLACAVQGKEPPAQKITPQALDALARQYRDAGLPLPPPDAPLSLLQVGAVDSGGTAWSVGFRIGPGTSSELPGRFLVGTETGEPYPANAKLPAARPLDPAKGLPTTVTLYGGWTYVPDSFPVNHWLALAVQCHLRGYDRLAEQLFARGLTRDAPAARRLTPLGDGGPRDSLAATAWNHWMNALLTESIDRREILAHLEKLSAEFPALDGAFQRDYVASLRLTVVPSRAAPDSVEALVDGLIDHNAVDNPDDACLEGLGFEAVPALLAHLDDRRLTRSAISDTSDGTNEPVRVGKVAGDLVQEIAGDAPEFLPGPTGRPPGQPMDPAAFARWWTRASATGEEAYMTREVFPPTEVSLQIVSARYPQRLGEVYGRILQEHPEVDASRVAMAISTCAQLPQGERVRLLRFGVASPNAERCLEALAVLMGFDPPAEEAALIERLDHWPTDVQTSYAAQPPEGRVSEFLMSTDSAEVWQAHERALFRATPALRMEMLNCLAGIRTEPPADVRQLALLDLFLDDPEVRIIRKEDQAPGGKFEGYSVTPETQKLRVGDFVADLLGKILKVKPPPGSAHTERWWAKYREAIRAAIDEHEREGLQTPVAEP